MTWKAGQAEIAELVKENELEQVPINDSNVKELINDSHMHLATARLAMESGDLKSSHLLAYDAFRKSVTALLAAQGLRPTSIGGHSAVDHAIRAQFPTREQFRAFGRLRRARNKYEYPGSESGGPSSDEVEDAIKEGEKAVDASRKILDSEVLSRWLP
ncbi:MAG: HEPN domain-containing protein [Ilumatobacteraceae bacterium]